jgi:hypothetical protein
VADHLSFLNFRSSRPTLAKLLSITTLSVRVKRWERRISSKMRLLSLYLVPLLVAFALGDDNSDLPPPGEAALPYTDGSFSEPNGGTASYDEGNQMNISWTTTYATSNLYLIVGYEWAAPVQLASSSTTCRHHDT